MEMMIREELEIWIFRFCFGQQCTDWNKPVGCQYGSENICRLVVDVEAQEPVDYCPLVRFLGWLSEGGRNRD